jgi:ribosomal protein L35AE/L33A
MCEWLSLNWIDGNLLRTCIYARILYEVVFKWFTFMWSASSGTCYHGVGTHCFCWINELSSFRSKSNQYPSTSLLQIEGVNTSEEVNWYLGKRLAYVYKAKTKKNGSQFRCVWGKVARPHGSSGVLFPCPNLHKWSCPAIFSLVMIFWGFSSLCLTLGRFHLPNIAACCSCFHYEDVSCPSLILSLLNVCISSPARNLIIPDVLF